MAEGSLDQRGGRQRQRRRRSVIAPRAAEVISAYVASAELAARAPPPLWGAGLCSYSAGVASLQSVRPAPPCALRRELLGEGGNYNPADANWRVRPLLHRYCPVTICLTCCSCRATLLASDSCLVCCCTKTSLPKYIQAIKLRQMFPNLCWDSLFAGSEAGVTLISLMWLQIKRLW